MRKTMAGKDGSGSERSFPKQWFAIGVALIAVAAGTLFALSGQIGSSRTASPAHAEQSNRDSANSNALSDAIFSVEGMSCGACAASVKRTLKEVDGVADVEVSLAERSVRVRYAEEKVTPQALAEAINELGYNATAPAQRATKEPHVETPAETSAGKLEMQTVTIPIDGMACEYCAQSVKERLTDIDGVKEVGIDLKEKQARVQYIEGLATPDRLVEAINSQGFRAGTPVGKGE
jgi:Cu+-exporting ATPase